MFLGRAQLIKATFVQHCTFYSALNQAKTYHLASEAHTLINENSFNIPITIVFTLSVFPDLSLHNQQTKLNDG